MFNGAHAAALGPYLSTRARDLGNGAVQFKSDCGRTTQHFFTEVLGSHRTTQFCRRATGATVHIRSQALPSSKSNSHWSSSRYPREFGTFFFAWVSIVRYGLYSVTHGGSFQRTSRQAIAVIAAFPSFVSCVSIWPCSSAFIFFESAICPGIRFYTAS